ncbi:MAG: sterol-binding protein, partial [Burkholderiales bacterium]|nr:sterol-binding protein [Burkholderiales bacterium]
SPLDALRFLAGDREVFRQATLEGDVAFAATLRHLAANLRWDYEEDLSRFIGDVAAHRAAEMLRTVVAWPREAGARMAQSGAEYITEEAGWLPPAAEVEAWLQAVDRLRDDTERLEQRIAALEARRG